MDCNRTQRFEANQTHVTEKVFGLKGVLQLGQCVDQGCPTRGTRAKCGTRRLWKWHTSFCGNSRAKS